MCVVSIAFALSFPSFLQTTIFYDFSDRYERSSLSLHSPSNGVARGGRTDTPSPLRRGRAGVGDAGNDGGGGGVFGNATSTLTRAFRKSSASLTRRPAQAAASVKAPSALSLEQPPSRQMPLIKARLEANGGKLKRPVISGPVMISNPTLGSQPPYYFV